MITLSHPARARRLLAALTAALIGVAGAVTVASPASADTAVVVSVSPSTDIDTTVDTSLAISGRGFASAEPITVALVTESDWAANGAASTPLVADSFDVIAGMEFETALDVPAGTLDPAIAYGVATFAAADRGYDTFTAITLAVRPADEAETTEEATEEAATEETAQDDSTTADQAVVEEAAAPQTFARVAGLSTVAAGNVTGGTVAWGISTYLNSANFGRPNPLPSAYVAPASFNASSRISTWGGAIGTVNADGSATLGFDGSSVNFASTGGGWLRLSDLEATLDASGNGSVTAVVAYGTAVGSPLTYDPAQTPTRGPERVTLVTLTGNAATVVRNGENRSWPALSGSWNPAFTSFLAGDMPSIGAWSYASTVSGATDRTPSTFAFSVDVQRVATPTTYDLGSAQWGLSTYLNSANFGRPNPLPSGYVAPAAFDATSRLSTWGGGSGTVNSDGTASLAFQGTSVNFAGTGGGWLRLKDVQATLDASGNGVVSAIVSYGTAVGTPLAYDPAQAPVNGPTRIDIVTLSGNSAPVVQGATTATWTGLNGSWTTAFTTFLSGSGVTTPWSYASTVSGATDRTPRPFTFALGITPPAVTPTVSLAVAPSASVVVGTAVTLTATLSPAAAGTVQFRDGATPVGTAPVGSGSATFSTSSFSAGDHSVTASFTPADPAAFTSAQSAATTVSVSAPVVAQTGSLIWGVKSSLQSYVLGGGSISTSGGAGGSGSSFLFPQESSAAFDQSAGTGTSSYRGTVTFAYPAHGFSISLGSPRVRVDSATSGMLIVDVTYNGATTSGVSFASLFLGAASKSSGGGSTTFSGVPASLTTAGATAFQGFYRAGESLDPVTFVVGSPAASFAATSASAPAAFVPPATPPATTGITGDPKVLGALKDGDTITVSASGYQPNETDVHVVIYSTPVELGVTTADANGVATWTGRLPAGLTGKHTLTFQGSVDRGIVLDIAPRVATAAVGCPVDAATLDWGFKETFRSYISGSIANGQWTVADGATYDIPTFGWSNGKGAYDQAGGLVAFTGSVTFTGHGGVLNTTIANPQLRFVDKDTAVLLLDVSGTTQDGASVAQTGVEFVEIDLAGAVPDADGRFAVTDAPTTLTAAGAAAFGTYPAGEAFDPVSFTLDTECATAVKATDAGAAPVTAEPVSTSADLTWLWILLAVVVLLIAAAVVTLAVRRRRTA